MKLSVVLATKNEEANVGLCLESVKKFADEIIVFDEASTDKTVEIVRKFDAKVTNYVNKTNFHETKEKAIEAASGDWILQLDADEIVSPMLAEEIKSVLENHHSEYISKSVLPDVLRRKVKLFSRHQELIRERYNDEQKSHYSQTVYPEVHQRVAYFIPRLNFFLGKALIHAGVYPDGVIRLFKKGIARLPGKSVHELMEVDGDVGWLFNDLEHHESPTFSRYFERFNRYTDLTAEEYQNRKLTTSACTLFRYSFLIPGLYFLKLYFLHRGYKDGIRGFLWSSFSSLHYPIAYFKYWQSVKKYKGH
jgi:glycosyltransferase involved in cell wall biosynthesis